MRLLLFTLFVFPLCLSASVMRSADADLAKARADYANAAAQIAEARKDYAAQIAAAKARSEELERELAALGRERSLVENYSSALAEKDARFNLLRSDSLKLAQFLKERGDDGISISHDTALFMEGFKNLAETARKDANPERIFASLVLENAAEAAANYNAGKTQELEIDPSLGGLSKVSGRSLREHFAAGGIWMYPILIFGIAAFSIAFAKLLSSLKAKRAPANLVGEICGLIKDGKSADAEALASKAPYPYKDMLSAFVKNRALDRSLLEEMSYEHMLDVGEKLYSRLGVISVTAAVAPLFGLLGTVAGIIKTFGDMSLYGGGNSKLMSAGIGEALITTEFGLVVAIPAIVLHALLTRRAKAVLSDMEKLAAAFISTASK